MAGLLQAAYNFAGEFAIAVSRGHRGNSINTMNQRTLFLRFRGGKSEIRISKSEKNSNARNSNNQTLHFGARYEWMHLFRTLGFWICFGFRISCFGFVPECDWDRALIEIARPRQYPRKTVPATTRHPALQNRSLRNRPLPPNKAGGPWLFPFSLLSLFDSHSDRSNPAGPVHSIHGGGLRVNFGGMFRRDPQLCCRVR